MYLESMPKRRARSMISSTKQQRATDALRSGMSVACQPFPHCGCAAPRQVLFSGMTTTTNPASSARVFALPNLLTYRRIPAVPTAVGCMYFQAILEYGLWLRWVALVVFIAAGLTDVLDGYVARSWGHQSVFGRMLDPIADKLLVSSCLLMLAADGTIRGWALWAAIVILCREILVSGLREYLAELRVSVPVTQL